MNRLPLLVRGHRVFGYVFLALYVYFLWQMVPRLWTYQIEFPARTVMHFTLGMAIGPLLLLKILIVRFFPRLEGSLAPTLGTALLVGATVLIGLSGPFALQETARAWTISQGGFLSDENLVRVRGLLAQTGLDEDACAAYASPAALLAGRDVLRRNCVECHDLRTVLARPRTPENWLSTVRRMADRTTLFNPLDETEQRQVTAYLIAVSPKLQQTAAQMRAQELSRATSQQAAQAVAEPASAVATFDPAAAQRVFESKCAECHGVDLVEQATLRTADDARDLVTRMVDAGLSATEEELTQIVQHLSANYVKSDQRE
jgi:mono/diheme cytochrome c family protein